MKNLPRCCRFIQSIISLLIVGLCNLLQIFVCFLRKGGELRENTTDIIKMSWHETPDHFDYQASIVIC